MKAPRMLAQNVLGLLAERKLKQADLAQWCRRSDPWVSQFLRGERNWQLDDLDRVADFFGLATYQLFQPGLTRSTERRSSLDRRQRRERRVSHRTRQAAELEAALKREPPVVPVTDELLLIQKLRQNPTLAAAVRQIARAAPEPQIGAPPRRPKKPASDAR